MMKRKPPRQQSWTSTARKQEIPNNIGHIPNVPISPPFMSVWRVDIGIHWRILSASSYSVLDWETPCRDWRFCDVDAVLYWMFSGLYRADISDRKNQTDSCRQGSFSLYILSRKMLRKIVRWIIFEFLTRKYKYLQFPTTVQLGGMCPNGGACSTLHVAYRESTQGCIERWIHYFHDGSIILDIVKYGKSFWYMHMRTHERPHIREPAASSAHACAPSRAHTRSRTHRHMCILTPAHAPHPQAHTHALTSTRTCRPSRTHIHAHACPHTRIRTCAPPRTHSQKHVHTYARMHVRTHMHIHRHLHVGT